MADKFDLITKFAIWRIGKRGPISRNNTNENTSRTPAFNVVDPRWV